MSSVSMTGSIYSSIVSKNKGMGGLATGLDTESIMEALTASTRAKIGKQQQLKQLAQWRQTNYRSVATGLKAFREKHLTFTSGTNIGSSSYFNTIKASTTSNKVKVTTTSNSTLDPIKIDQVVQLATAHTIQGKSDVKQTLTSDAAKAIDLADPSLSFAGKTLQLTVDGATKTIKLDSLEQYKISAEDAVDPTKAAANAAKIEDFQTELQNLLTDAFGTKLKAGVADEDGYVDPSKLNESENFEPVVIASFAETTDGKFTINLEHSTGTVTMGAGAARLGFEVGDSNRINVRSTKIKDIDGLGEDLVGNALKFKINGVEFAVDPNETISSLMDRVNSSTAGVRMSYDSVTNSFEIISKTAGHTNRIDMEDVQGNFLNEMFGAKSATSLTSKEFFNDAEGFTANTALDFQSTLASKSESQRSTFATTLGNMTFTLDIGGTSKTILLSDSLNYSDFTSKVKDGTATNQDFVNTLNSAIQYAFNDTKIDVQFKLGTDGKVSLLPSSEKSITMTAGKQASTDMLTYLGFRNAANRTFTNKIDVSNEGTISGNGAINTSLTNSFAGDTYEFDLTVNGVTKNISYQLTDDDVTALRKFENDDTSTATTKQSQYLAQKINNKIYEEFGTDVAKVNGTAVTMQIGIEVTSDGNARFRIDRDSAVSLSASNNVSTDPDIDIIDALSHFRLPEANNLSEGFKDSEMTLERFGVTTGGTLVIGNTSTGEDDPIEIVYTANMSISELADEINAAGKEHGIYAGIQDGRLVIKGGEDFKIKEVNGGDLLEGLYGIPNTGYESQGQDYGSRESGGNNAQIIVNGQILSSASNTFTINGSQVEVLETTEKGETININMASDPDELIEKLRDFINDYNGLVTLMSNMVKEGKSTDYDYSPLTDEQRAEMTTDEIAMWETEAKKGIMRNDSTISSIMNQMRSILYEPVGNSGVSLYDLGITTVSVLSDPSRNGHLEITKDNEEKLRNMIINNPDKVREVFANTENGLAKKLDNVIDRAINTSSNPSSRGSLIAIAGTSTLTGDNTSTLDRKISQYDEAIEKLKTRLEAEYSRYWKQFSALETAIQNMNTQSSWLTEFSA